MKNLYIIGNGFDLYHKLDTKYQSFAQYLAKVDSEIYEYLLMYYRMPDLTTAIVKDEDYDYWAKFETALADLDYKQVLEDNSDYIGSPGSPDGRSRDWHSYQIQMNIILDKLTGKLISHFNSFILKVDYPKSIKEQRINFKPKSKFLSFNYTSTLDLYYGIKHKNICYIHNKSVDEQSKIVLGHGTNPRNFEEEPVKPPKNLTEEELYKWREYMNDQYDFSFESAKTEILSYYERAFKNTKSNIQRNKKFFKNLDNIENVYVLGHSISEVDYGYFDKVIRCINPKAKWFVSYYNKNEKNKHKSTLVYLGVNKNRIKIIMIDELK